MRRTVEHLFDKRGNFAEVQRAAVLFDREVRVVAHTFGFDVRGFCMTPFAKRILADIFRNGEPAAQHLLVAVFIVNILQFLQKTVEHLPFRYEVLV